MLASPLCCVRPYTLGEDVTELIITVSGWAEVSE